MTDKKEAISGWSILGGIFAIYVVIAFIFTAISGDSTEKGEAPNGSVKTEIKSLLITNSENSNNSKNSQSAQKNTCSTPTVTDADGNIYNTVSIGNQCWMANNMRRGIKLANASTLPSDNSIIEKWCYDDDCTDIDTYGGLYTWAESMGLDPSCNKGSENKICNPKEPTQGICPVNWHIPSDPEWMTLIESQGGVGCTKLEGDCLPAVRKLLGGIYVENRDNKRNIDLGSSIFNLQASGGRHPSGTYLMYQNEAFLWSSTIINSIVVSRWNFAIWGYDNTYDYPNSSKEKGINGYMKEYGFSVRCIQDVIESTYQKNQTVNASKNEQFINKQETSKSASYYLKEWKRLDSQGSNTEALKIINELIAIYGNNPKAYPDLYLWKGMTLSKLGRDNDALVAIDTAIRLKSTDVLAYEWKGKTLINLKKYNEAIEAFSTAIKIDNTNIYLYIGKLTSLYKLGRYKEVFLECEKTLRVDIYDEQSMEFAKILYDDKNIGPREIIRNLQVKSLEMLAKENPEWAKEQLKKLK